MKIILVDRKKIWPTVLGGFTVISILGSLLYVGVYSWQGYKDFLAGPASGWAGAIGSVGAVFCAIWVARSDRRKDDEARERDAEAAATWVIAIHQMQRDSFARFLKNFDSQEPISELTYQRFHRAVSYWQPPDEQLLKRLELPMLAYQAVIMQNIAYRHAMTLFDETVDPELLGTLTEDIQLTRASAIHDTLPKMIAALDNVIKIVKTIQKMRADKAKESDDFS